MGKSQETFSKKEKEKKRLKKREEKKKRKEERREAAAESGNSLDDMIAYVDADGNLTDTPPDETVKKVEIDAADIEIGVPKKEESDEPSERLGRVEFFNDEKGYGFIKEEGTGEKFFVHMSGCKEPIGESDKVSFELEKGLKGLNAVNVTKV